MRLSRPRLLLRAVLLLVAAAFMAWRATETGQTARQPGLAPADAQLLGRIATIEWILALLALLTAGAVLLALRRRPRQRSLHLDGVAGEGAPPDRGPPA